MLNNSLLSQTTDNVLKLESEQNETLTQNVTVKNSSNGKITVKTECEINIVDQHFEINHDVNVTADERNVINHNNNSNHELTNESRISVINIRKLEDLCEIPQDDIKSEYVENTENIKVEDTNSSQICSPNNLTADSDEWYSKRVKILQETPTLCKRVKYSPTDSSSPNKQKRRKLDIDIENYDQLPDAIKSELYNIDLHNTEAIDMLHDIDSLPDFDESKVYINIFSSTANDSIDNENIDMSTHPEVDPLAITDNDEDNTIAEDRKVKQKGTKWRKFHKPRKQLSRNIKSETEATRMSIDKSDDLDYDHLKEVLGHLDIDLNIEGEEIEEEEERQEMVKKEEKKEEISKEAIKKLYNLNVNIIHEVPPQHTLGHTAGSKTLTPAEKKIFLKYGPLKCGPFTPSEDTIIKENWKTFCKVHDWNPKHVQPFLYTRFRSHYYIKSVEQRKKFVQFIANGIPWRSLYSVYHRFKYLHKSHEKDFKRYTPDEDKVILSHMKTGKRKRHRKYAELSKILGRNSHSIWVRHQLLKKMKAKKTTKLKTEVKWTLPLIGTFIKDLMSITLCDNVKDLKDAILPKAIWLKLAESLGIEDRILKSFWLQQLHAQLFSPEPIFLNDIKIKLIEYVYGKGISSTREIVWSSVAKYFEGITGPFLCKMFLYLVQEASIKIGTKDLPPILEYLYNKKIDNIKNELTDKFLPRLSYDDDEVNFVDEDIEEDT
ncbi:hypothetical protein ANTPLA_LOCUS4468 [Anthophora plagiata]